MGVKGLTTFLKKINGEDDFIKKINLYELNGKKVGIDASIFIYRFLYKPHFFVESFITMVYTFLVNGIIPIFVFDGAPPTEKNNELQARRDKKDDYQKKIDEMNELIKMENCDKINELKMEIEKLEKRVITLDQDYVKIAQDVLKLVGLPYLHLEYEAEFIASQLLKNGYIDYILSEDNDLFLLNCSSVLKDYSNIKNEITYYDFDSLLKKMDITYNQFVEVCLLVGVDYSGKLNRVNLNQAYLWIKEFKSIENLFKFKIITIHPDPENKIKNIIYQEIPDIQKTLEHYNFEKDKTDLIGLYELFKTNKVKITFKLKKILTYFKDDNHFRSFRD